ncbi:MAG: family 20 glycosylhydrolase [Bacteroidaceae bacterium]
MKINALFSTALLTVGIVLGSCSKQVDRPIQITPMPNSLVSNEGTFEINKTTTIVAKTADEIKVANYLASKLATPTGFNLIVKEEAPSSNFINLTIDAKASENIEGYKLDVTSDKVTILAPSSKGLFYGVQTTLQLLPPAVESRTLVNGTVWNMHNVSIQDAPRFSYRGMHIDVCRHFMPVETLKKQLDMMAILKLNTFHWHLTEDQGWRIEIKAFPKLTELGSKRTEGDGSTYGGFYTQEEVKDIVKYAADRMIEVIPEIELPGHALGALTAYPEYSCTGGPFKVRSIWGVEPDVYCAGKESTFDFISKIIDEVVPLFPSKYFHIGGDECPKVRWEKCPLCQKRMRKEGLKNEHELQSYFVQRVEKMLLKHGKKMIGWDEILEGGLAPSATVMSWRGEKGGIDAANQGHDVVMTPGTWCYLDHYQGDSQVEPVAIGGYATLEKTYSYNPVPKELDASKAKHILGTQGNVWTEYMYTPEILEYRIYPRIIALAEIGWTNVTNKDYKDFETRLNNLYPRMDELAINYHIPMPEGPCEHLAFIDTTSVTFSTTMPVKMVYTIDGTEPTAFSKEYTTPLAIAETTTIKIASVLPTRKMSPVRTVLVEKQTYAPASDVETTKEGLSEKSALGTFIKVADLDKAKVWKDVESTNKYDMDEPSASILTGYIDIAEEGIYEFNTDVDQLFLDGTLVVNNDGEVKRFSRHRAQKALAAGKHEVKIIFLNNIIGGWPTAWNGVKVLMKKVSDKEFKTVELSQLTH